MSIVSSSSTDQLVAELYKIDGKAEIIGGRIVMMSPTGPLHGRAALAITFSLMEYERKVDGVAYGDNVGFLVDLPNRKSFCPDASFHTGPSTGMEFLDRSPDFAVEVRSKGDYGPAAELKMAAKRADYFEAGTKVVWDVDLQGDDIVRVYRADSPDEPTIYRKGDSAEAEPAVPGWTFAVSELFDR